jgi:protein-tyrosine phosphatase
MTDCNPDIKKEYARTMSTCQTIRFTVFIAIGLIVASSATLSADESAQKARSIDKRHVDLEGQSNFRDLGGYKTKSGRTVKWGQVYRSGGLARLTDKDVGKLEQLGIETVVNFLTDEETEALGKDRLPGGVREILQPIESDGGLVSAVNQARETADFSRVPTDMNPQFHRILVNDARKQYAALLREIANSDGRPVVFHCSHGVHRTGTATAVLLWALGVPWETVREDYLLSNIFRKDESQKRLLQLRQLAAKNQNLRPEEVDMTNIEAFYILQENYIDATRDEILKKYDSIDGYLTQGLKLTRDEIQQLHDCLLE